MTMNELVDENRTVGRRATHVACEPVSERAKSAHAGRLRCVDVARNRASRYAKRHRIVRPLWPLIATAILVGLVFERRPIPTLTWTRKRAAPDNGDIGHKSLSSQESAHSKFDPIAQPSPIDTGEILDGEPKPQYRPLAHFLAEDVAQTIAFLIRNRGHLDNDVVREKWKIIDDFSLPLAVYLREIESLGAWDALAAETSAVKLDSSARLPQGMPRAVRHQTIVSLLSEWQKRGEAMLSKIGSSGGTDGDQAQDAVLDGQGNNDKPPMP